jgi:hypothetical protein
MARFCASLVLKWPRKCIVPTSLPTLVRLLRRPSPDPSPLKTKMPSKLLKMRLLRRRWTHTTPVLLLHRRRRLRRLRSQLFSLHPKALLALSRTASFTTPQITTSCRTRQTFRRGPTLPNCALFEPRRPLSRCCGMATGRTATTSYALFAQNLSVFCPPRAPPRLAVIAIAAYSAPAPLPRCRTDP